MYKTVQFSLYLVAIFVLTVLLAGLISIPMVLTLGYATHTYDNVMTADETTVEDFKNVKLMAPSTIVAVGENGDEHVLGVFYDQNRVIVSPEEIPQFILHATVAAEDKNFYQHNGLNVESVIRAALANYNNERVVQGGSTITQQYIKNVLVQEAEWLADDDKNEAYYEATQSTLTRKLNELRYAVAIEKVLPKDQIITNYLNIVGFGGQIYGITAAAEYYYGKKVSELSLYEAATLIGIINAPKRYRIDRPESTRNGEKNGYADTKERRNYVIYQMFLLGFITEQQYNELRAKPVTPNINTSITGCRITGWGDYMCNYVLSEIQQTSFFGTTPQERLTNFRRGGYKIVTTINPTLQQETQNIIREHVPAFATNINIGAAVTTVKSDTGHILVMQQNTQFSPTRTDEGITPVNFNANRQMGGSTGFQTGSTFKIFTLIEWLKSGKTINNSVTGLNNYRNMPKKCEENGKWTGDYNVYNSGQTAASLIARDPETGEPLIDPETGQQILNPPLTTSVTTATAASYNTIFMSMAQQLDLCDIADLAEKMGHVRADGNPIMSDPAMVLGVNETAPIHVAQSYSVLSNFGSKCEITGIKKIESRLTGETLYTHKPSCEALLEESVVRPATTALSAAASGTGAPSNPRDGVAVAIKTGTSDDSVHTWVAGYTSETTTVVWVGNIEGTQSLTRFRYNNQQGNNIRHSLFKKVQTEVNTEYGGVGSWREWRGE